MFNNVASLWNPTLYRFKHEKFMVAPWRYFKEISRNNKLLLKGNFSGEGFVFVLVQ